VIDPTPTAVLTSLLRLSEGTSVLYVEDEPSIRMEITEMLETLFAKVVTAENGTQALECFSHEEFALVITDINMPETTGIDFIKALQKTRPQQAIVVTSAYSDSGNLIPLINLGVGSFILKPLDWKLFLTLIHKELAGALGAMEEVRYQKRLEKEVQLRTEELRESQSQVVRLQEAKDNMLALISHELRTPLNGILGFIELIRPALNDTETLAFLDHVENSARRLERSTRKALDFSSLSTGKRPIHRENHSVGWLLRAAQDQVASRLEKQETLKVIWEGPVEASIFTDAQLVVEILKNLLENAVKYAGPDPTVSLAFERQGSWEVLTIRDSGPGFSQTTLETLFQPFSTGNIMHHSEGMGLGLALVDVIMMTLGGRVDIRNFSEGGAEVRLRFPIVKASSQETRLPT
jgi:two-component system, sensor histidine kinase and response regulator